MTTIEPHITDITTNGRPAAIFDCCGFAEGEPGCDNEAVILLYAPDGEFTGLAACRNELHQQRVIDKFRQQATDGKWEAPR